VIPEIDTLHGVETRSIFRRMKEWMRNVLTYHPFGFALYFVLSHCDHKLENSTIAACFLVLLVLFISIVLVQRILTHYAKNSIKAGLQTTGILLFILYFSDLQPLLEKISPVLARYRYAVCVAFLLLLSGFWVLHLLKSHREIHRFVTILVNLCILFAAIEFGSDVLSSPSREASLLQELTTANFPSAHVDTIPKSSFPDIYYIIADSYTSSNSLKKYWGYDNGSFTKALDKRGFFIAGDSRSFARYTTYSMASTLNICADSMLLKTSWSFPERMVGQSSVISFLKNNEYEFHNLSGFIFPDADAFYYSRAITTGVIAQFDLMLWKTFLYQIINKIYNQWSDRDCVSIQNEIVKQSKQRPNSSRFIYAHLPIPHYPYYLRSNATDIPVWSQAKREDKEAYLEQVRGTNVRLLEMIDSIQVHASRPTVIVLQGDHGFRFFPEPIKFQESFTIMNAYYFSDKKYAGISPAISPYNTFRVILNKYFDTKLHLLPDTISGIRYHGSR
jgi:hypothetical protein